MESETAGIGVLIGAGLPLILSVINRPGWSSRTKSVLAFIVCLLAAAASSIVVEGVDVRDPNLDFVAYFGAVYGSAMVTFSRFWKKTGVAPTIERNT